MKKIEPQNLRAFFAKYGANIAGPIWLSGSALQFLIGAVTTSPLVIISSVFNLVAPASHALFGHKNGGVIAGCLLGIIGTGLAVYPGLLNVEPGTIFGFCGYVVAATAGIFSKSLTIKFGEAKNILLRHTLGNPRRMMGLTCFALCRLPIIYTGLAHGRGLSYITPFIIWGLGDLTFSLSRPNMGERSKVQDQEKTADERQYTAV